MKAVIKDMSPRVLNAKTEAYRSDVEMQNDKDLTLVLLEKRPELYEYASETLKADDDVALLSFRGDGRLIRFAPESIRSNPIIARVAVEGYPLAYRFLTGDAKYDLKIAEIVAKSGAATDDLAKCFYNNVDIACVAVNKNPKSIELFSESVRANERVCLTALAADRTSYVYFSDDAFLSDKVFERSLRVDRGVVAANFLSNETPAGLMERIAEKGLTIRATSQKIDFVTIDYDKLYLALSICVGNLTRKKEILIRIIDKDDRKCAELLCEKFSVLQSVVTELLPYAVQNRKTRVLPYLMSYVNTKSTLPREEREKIIRGLRRNSPKAAQTLIERISDYKTDREVVLLCALSDGVILKYLQDSPLFFDAEIVSACVKSYIVKNSDKPFVEWFENPPFSYDDLKVLCRKDWRNYFALDKDLQKDPVLCAEAVRSGIGVYDKIDDEMKTISIVKEAKR